MDSLYNPITGETVEISKAVSPMYGAKDAFANQPTRKIAALLPTGKHVSHANRLSLTRRGKRTSVGRYGDTKLQRFGKADEPKASGGRYATGMAVGPIHGLVAGKKGKKAQAFGSHYGHQAAGTLPGLGAMVAGVRTGNMKLVGGGYGAAIGGGMAGSHRAVTVNQRKGRYKPEVAKGLRDVARGAKEVHDFGYRRTGRAILTGGLSEARGGQKTAKELRAEKKGRRVSKSFEDLGDLSMQPGMINPGVQTSSWSHGTPNQNFAAATGRRGRKIA